MKNRLIVFLLLALLVCMLPCMVFANSPGPNPDGTFEISGAYVIFWVLVYGVLVGFTCLTEWLTAIPFDLHQRHAKTILGTNIVTQTIMHLLELLSIAVMPDGAVPLVWYPITVFVLEILIFVAEFHIYRRKMIGESKQRLLAYTVCANCASLLGGLLLLMFIF